MKRSLVIALAACFLLAAVSNVAMAAVAVAPAEELLSVVEEVEARSVAGGFRRGSEFVEFEAKSASPLVASAVIVVHGKRVTVTRDLGTGVAVWSGDGVTLVPEDRAALTGLVQELGNAWVLPAREQLGVLPAHKDLVARLAMLLAEAPLGVPLTEQQVPRPAEVTLKQDRVADGPRVVGACAEDVIATTVALSEERSAALAACQRAADDGILYYGSCATTGRLVCHDAAGHCYLCETVTAGPGSSGCMGECGPNCNGLNIYTYDCGDHDRCGRVHGGSTNPWDSECGDEYWDADDDFLWGWPNC